MLCHKKHAVRSTPKGVFRRLRGTGWPSLLLAVLLLPAIGCGTANSPVDYKPSDEQAVRFRISDTLDAKSDPERFRALFVDGAAPDDRLLQQYRQYDFYAPSAKVNGDTAVATVIAQDPETGDERGTVEWQLRRIDGQWQISDAPLPSGP